MGIIAAHDGSIYTFKKVSEPDVFYNIDNDTIEDFLILFKDEKDLLRAFRERLGFKVEHLS